MNLIIFLTVPPFSLEPLQYIRKRIPSPYIFRRQTAKEFPSATLGPLLLAKTTKMSGFGEYNFIRIFIYCFNIYLWRK